ncbi:MAG: LysR family transcriptional regulator [Pseudomonadota bacterium]
MQDQDWDDLRIVLAAARAGGFAAAGRQLGVDETTVKRRLTRAEARLATRIFERIAGRLTPTEAGRTLIARAEEAERTILSAYAHLDGADRAVAGTVRLTTVPILANHLLAPALGDLCTRYPGLEIELIAEPNTLSLTRREADLALRLSRPMREMQTVARRVGTLGYAVYGRGADLPWVTYEDRLRDLPQTAWIARQGNGGQIRVNDAETLLACLNAGCGRSLLPEFVGEASPLLRRLGPHAVLKREVWLVTHPDIAGLPRIRAVGDWLAGLLP